MWLTSGWRRTGLALLLALMLLLAILLLRTFSLRPLLTEAPTATEFQPRPSAPFLLAETVRIPTLATAEPEDRALHFAALRQLLQRSYPAIFSQLQVEWVNEDGLLLYWPGRDPALAPVLLMAHQDVVPIEPGTESHWRYPPFLGAVAEGFIWGRGAWDNKSTLVATLEALNALLLEGKAPQRSLYLAFGQDEEIGGELGAAVIAQRLRERGVRLAMVLDEGSMIYKPGVIAGIEQPIATIGVAEKGYLTLELTATGSGGHSSMPPQDTAVAKLAQALLRLQQNPLPAQLSTPVAAMYESLAPHMPFMQRLALANLWLFEPLVLHQMSGADTTNAYIRTTLAPTLLRAGIRDNVLPQSATATLNLRILPGQTSAQVIAELERILDDPQLSLREASEANNDPTPVAEVESWGYRQIATSIRQVRPDVLVAPTLLFGATDSRHFVDIADQVFRFTPISVDLLDASRIHGTDERISVADFDTMVRFYYQLLVNITVSEQCLELC